MANKRRDLRMIWNSNGAWTESGYAVEMRDVLSRLSADGWPIAQIAFWGLQGGPIYKYTDPPFDKGNPIKLYHKLVDDYGTDAMYHHAKDFKADVVFSMLDVPMLNTQILAQMKNEGIKWIPWLPVDREPVTPGILNNLKYAYKIITYSQWGHDLLQDAGFTSKLILEGTDTSVFKPMDKQLARQNLKDNMFCLIGGQMRKVVMPPQAFVMGMIAANKENPPRKGFQEALEAFAMFSANHPEAFFFFHNQQVQNGNFPFIQYAQHLGIENKVLVWDQIRSSVLNNDTTQDIVNMYNAMDVYLCPSQTEGFALTPVEAMSCGKPVLLGDNTAMTELIENGKQGYLSKIKYKWFTNQLAYQFVVDSDDLAQNMEKLYQDLKTDPKKIARECRKRVVKKYNIDTLVREKWISYLEELQEEVLRPAKLDSESPSVDTIGA